MNTVTRKDQVMDTAHPKSPPAEHLINREMSWLEFNQRVLNEAKDNSNPLLERLKFLAITGGNLDEFFMVRIGSLHILLDSSLSRPDVTGLMPQRQLDASAERIRRMMSEQYDCLREISQELEKHEIRQVQFDDLNRKQTEYLKQWFEQYIRDTLSPIMVDDRREFPLLVGSSLAVCVHLQWDQTRLLGGDWKAHTAPANLAAAGPAPSDSQPRSGADVGHGSVHAGVNPDTIAAPTDRFAIIPLGSHLDRFVTVPSETGHSFILLETLVKRFAQEFFADQKIVECSSFRITRNADMRVDEDGAFDLLQGMQQILSERKESDCVRLEIENAASESMQAFLLDCLEAGRQQVFFADGPLRLNDWFAIANLPGYEDLKNDPWPPQESPDFPADANLFEVIRSADRLLYHPYQSFDPVVRLVEAAAEDPDVLAIKQTLYRTSRKSPIVQALERAALNKKNVTVVVELKARFDEARNIEWAKRLERAGVNVIYGVRGLKTHAKVCIVVRKDTDRLRRYMHFGTGNYNEATAGIYSDASLFTCDDALGNDAVAFFNAVTGMSTPQPLQKLSMAPLNLRQKLLEMIDVETENARRGIPSSIRAKVNSLVDPQMIQALYRASQAGVPIDLNVRGVCCLRPGVPGLSESIRVVSIVDRLLEHSRILFFHHGGDARVFISSADWMGRNLDRRIELLVPIDDYVCRSRLLQILDQYFEDNVKAHQLMSDGSYVPISNQQQTPHRSQYELYKNALQMMAEHSRVERSMFQPYRGQ